MTQENKFAIIIGFALLLVVGILVSDHLAEVARGAPGSLAARDPLAANDQRAIEYVPLVAVPAPATEVAQSTESVAGTPLPTAHGLSHPVHIVSAGDTLSSIALRYYGDRTLAADLSVHNGLPNPDKLRAGLRLIIPPTAEMPQSLAAPAILPPADANIQVAQSASEYEVRPGDTLSELAQQLMGSARHTDRLLELNRDRLSSADDLRIGLRLRYHPPEHASSP
ncbi:MAG: LysM peptidoglycan-binding domain-containing protein [Planctomycetes bacterium]|jgi:nucleoid-associated protein YgaU|nr:LysM peptidoglycan-binding domain-containing protein [Planctomycetota bacterium]MCP4837758.1 LysM peptidoglycan-binding domain-containing protein [Planctomycetota bacterium]